MKRDKLDAVFSDLVRERANWRCEVCEAGREAHLECSHIFGRGKISTRWHPDNALCLCHHHHRVFTQHPLIHAEFVRERFGVAFYDQLIRLANQPRHFSKAEKEAIYKAYKVALAEMKKLREADEFERIPFAFPDLANVPALTTKKNDRKAIGGHARAAALTSEQRKAIAKKAAKTRWAKRKLQSRPFPKQHRPVRRKVAA